MKIQEMRKKPENEEEATIIELIVFRLGEEEFAADISQVREIIRIGSIITPIPESPDFIKGVTNVRGQITVAIDLKERFYLPAKKGVECKHIVITEQEKDLFGLMVDEVTEVLRIPHTEIKPTPKLVTGIDRTYISGEITTDNRLIILLDLNKVLSEEELIKLSKIQLKHGTAIEQRPEAEGQITKAEEKEGLP